MPTDINKLKGVKVGTSPSKGVANAAKIATNAQRPGTTGQSGVNDALGQQYNKKTINPETISGG